MNDLFGNNKQQQDFKKVTSTQMNSFGLVRENVRIVDSIEELKKFPVSLHKDIRETFNKIVQEGVNPQDFQFNVWIDSNGKYRFKVIDVGAYTINLGVADGISIDSWLNNKNVE